MTEKKIWFKRKRYGWGWYPVTWQGWAVLLVYLGVIVPVAVSVDSNAHSLSDSIIGFAIPWIALTSVLIGICYKKGETPRWQWGQKDDFQGSK